MKLIGNYLSPYVRRVAVSLNAMGMPFELDELLVFKEPERVRAHNPVTRIPTLILDDGEVLIDSAAILDALDQMAGPEKALTPAAGAERRRVLKVAGIAVAAMEKAQWAVYELRFHPDEKVHQPWIEHNEAQALGGLAWLDELAAESGAEGWLAGTPAMSQADITGAIAYSFCNAMRPNLALADKAPNLARFAARREAMEIFQAAPMPG
jgi:glutathione S-transferase